MHRTLHLLLAFAVLWCGLHLAETDAARVGLVHADQPASAMIVADDHAHEGSGAVKDACHHHCPVAPDLWASASAEPVGLLGGMLFARAVAPMASMAQAPPLQPPAA